MRARRVRLLSARDVHRRLRPAVGLPAAFAIVKTIGFAVGRKLFVTEDRLDRWLRDGGNVRVPATRESDAA